MTTEPAATDGIWDSIGDDGVARIELDAPGRMNALTPGASARIVALCEQWAGDPAVRVVVLSGRGGAFSAGADVARMASHTRDAGYDQAASYEIIERGSRLVAAVRSLPMPVIAAVDGAAAGIGASLAVAADLVYATARSYFLLPFVALGLMPDGGATALFAASIGRARANELALLGERLFAAEALAHGLINGVADGPEALEAAVARATARLVAASATALATTKAALDAHTLAGFGDVLGREIAGQTELLQSPEFRAAVARFRKPD